MEGDDKCDPDRPAHPGTFLAGEAGQSDGQPGGRRIDFPVSVVLPAGGTGERTGLKTPKQFCSVLGRPLISYTIQSFERVSWIQNIVVVVAKENMDLMTNIMQRFQHRKVRVVPGGSTRHRSIYNGVLALGGQEEEEGSADRPKVVIIHDAVRPFVEEDFLYEIVTAAKEQGAAGAVRPLVSTVIATTSEGYLDHSLERSKYRASEMPQGFIYDVIAQAYQRSTESDFDFGTECLHLVLQHCGTKAKLVQGPPTLWKVTYRRDLAAAESIVRETLSRSACVVTGEASSRAHTLALALQELIAPLDVALDVVPDVRTDVGRCLLTETNFIQVSVNSCGLTQIKSLLTHLEAANGAVLQPLVVIWVDVRTWEEPSVSETTPGPAAIMGVASAAKLRNILLYGVRLHQTEDGELWQRSLLKVAEISAALIRERSPVLVGQVLQA